MQRIVPKFEALDAPDVPQPAESKLWIIWNMNGNGPRKPYFSRAAAEDASINLARLNPDQVFFVLVTVSAYCTPQPAVRSVPLTEAVAQVADNPF